MSDSTTTYDHIKPKMWITKMFKNRTKNPQFKNKKWKKFSFTFAFEIETEQKNEQVIFFKLNLNNKKITVNIKHYYTCIHSHNTHLLFNSKFT